MNMKIDSLIFKHCGSSCRKSLIYVLKNTNGTYHEKNGRMYIIPDNTNNLKGIDLHISKTFFHHLVYNDGEILGLRRFSLYSKIPISEYVYHLTYKRNLESIVNLGLIPQSSNTGSYGHGPMVFVSESLEERWSGSFLEEEWDSKILLKIRASSYQWFKDTNLHKRPYLCTFDSIMPKDIVSVIEII